MAENNERDYLLALQHILKHKNEDPLIKCQEIIYNIWNTLKNEDFNENAKLEPTFLRQGLASVNILLKVYETLYKEQISTSASHFNIELIFDYLNDATNETLLSDNLIQNNLLQIISSILKIVLLENSSKNFNELCKFYFSNIKILQNYTERTESCKVNLIFRLKIIYTIYESLEHLSKSTLHEKQILFINDKLKEYKILNNVDELKSYVQLLLYSDEDIFTILLLLIPECVKYFKDSSILKYIWEEICHHIKPLMSVENKNQRILFILCHLIDVDSFFLKEEEKLKVWESFLKNSNFWLLIQIGLNEKDTLKRKQAMYLFKKSINVLEKNDITILSRDTENKRIIFFWDVNFNCKIYQELITVLEFLDEQQVHIIKPVFQMTYDLVEKLFFIFTDKAMDFSWILLIYEKALMHESTQVVKWGLSNLLQLPDFFFSIECILEKIVCLVVSSLNDLNIYYNEGLSVSEELILFFKKISGLKTSKIFFKLFINKICDLIWPPEALFFVANALAKVQDSQYWEEDEILKINKFISTALTTHNKFTKAGVVCLLLESVINLTNVKSVSCDKVILLLSNFFKFEMGRKKKIMRTNVILWLRKSYSPEIAEETLDEYKSGSLSDDLNENKIAQMFILFYYAFGNGMSVNEDGLVPYCFVSNQLVKILLTFKDLAKRLYCDESLQIHYLSIVYKLIQKERENDEKESKLLNLIKPFVTFIVQYIQSQVKLVSDLKDFSKCKLYVKTLKNVFECKLLLDAVDNEAVNRFLQELEDNLMIDRENIPVVRIYCSLILLEVIVPYHSYPENILQAYLVKELNNSLEKEESYFESSKDIQILWGRINSEYLKAKWVLYAYFFTQSINFSKTVQEDELLRLCSEGLDIGGYGVLCPIMSILKLYLPELINNSEGKRLIDSIWNTTMERRKNDDFKFYISEFVDMLFQERIYSKGKFWEIELIRYAELLFEDTSLCVVNIFMKHINKFSLNDYIWPFLCHVLIMGSLFGPLPKKDEKLAIQVWSYMTKDDIWQIGDYTTSNEIRARALKKVFFEIRNSFFLSEFLQKLCEKANELSRNKVGYFGNSYIHRVKLRLMQALVLFMEESQLNTICDYVLNSLSSENPQPSVKYLQEWCLIYYSSKKEVFEAIMKILNNPSNQKPKLISSLISVIYHLPVFVTNLHFDSLLMTIMSFCMDQNFEVRLHAQVAAERTYEKYGEKFDNKHGFKYIPTMISDSLNRTCGNARKTYEKLKKHFFFDVFNSTDNWSLETIFVNLPRLSGVESDEWISVELFKFCGWHGTEIRMEDPSLRQIKSTDSSTKKEHSKPFDEADEIVNNYQKKMIPSKSVLPQYDECYFELGSNSKSKALKGSLVVVASLVDRIPNLGGLVRTCEIFGASEFIVNSLKYLEDKQFTSLSVTAEKWITVKEVRSENLKEYILEMKKSGYSVVGAEQALYSEPLKDVKFSKKTLLLLGNEKEGIPPNLLALLDHCVEIPQMGVIRSLNVHVTGALFIWEYAKQNCFL